MQSLSRSFALKGLNFLLITTLIILTIGVLYRLVITANGNFIFNMDNARDMVDIRSMVVLKEPRLIGGTTGIQGLFYGPSWYYLSSIPFILTHGDPYGSILMEVVLWVIGGVFLLKISSKYGKLSTIIAGLLWIASPPVVLASRYAFNPNPVIFLFPALVFFLEKLLSDQKSIYSFITWGFVGFFTNLEINFAIFLPLTIFLIIIASKKTILFKKIGFWIGISSYFLFLSPLALFDIKHQFLMTKALLNYIRESSMTAHAPNIIEKIKSINSSFFNVFSSVFFNLTTLSAIIFILYIFLFIKAIKEKNLSSDKSLIICSLFLIIPYFGYILLNTQLSLWDLGGLLVPIILIYSFTIKKLQDLGFLPRIFAVIFFVLIVYYSSISMVASINESFTPSGDPSAFKNELQAVDYVYQKAGGKNFKVYSFLPSVIDYPYQYLFWWAGLRKYGYTPEDYAYLPNQPEYIKNKDLFNVGNNTVSSNLIYLIEEPDSNNTRIGWENHFLKYPILTTQSIGPLNIETRIEKN